MTKSDELQSDKERLAHTDHPLRHYDHNCPACKAADLVELLDHWRTFPAPSNEFVAVEIIEELQRELAATRMHLDAACEAIGHSPMSSEPLSAAITRRLSTPSSAEQRRDPLASKVAHILALAEKALPGPWSSKVLRDYHLTPHDNDTPYVYGPNDTKVMCGLWPIHGPKPEDTAEAERQTFATIELVAALRNLIHEHGGDLAALTERLSVPSAMEPIVEERIACAKAMCPHCREGKFAEYQSDPVPTYWHDATRCRASEIWTRGQPSDALGAYMAASVGPTATEGA